MIERLERMPVSVLPAFVGALTLGNIYGEIGYPAVRHITMIASAAVWLLYFIKMIRFPKICIKEYQEVIPCSLYAAFFIILMGLGGYCFEFMPGIGRTIWAAGVIMHMVHILVFTFRNVIRKRNIHTFVPSWFVTYNAFMVSCVSGTAMGVNHLLKYIVYYGIIVYFILMPLLIWRLCAVEINDEVYHTMAVILSPCSLCVVSYLNIIEQPNRYMVYFLYICVLVSLLFIILKLPKFFRYAFTPGFAGLTFPMAIGITASNKMSAYLLDAAGNEPLSKAASQIAGIQIYLTTMLVGYVLLNFVIMALKLERR